MILEKIKEANDVKQLSLSECEQLAQEIRDFLIRSLSETGGHLASNLGVVELKGHRQGGAQPLFPVFAPDEEGIVVASGINVHRAVDLISRQGGGADDHIVLAQLIALSDLPDLPGEL